MLASPLENLPVQIIVQLLILVASLAGALFAWFQAWTMASLKVESELHMENIRSQNEKRKNAFDVANAEANPLEEAINLAWRDIQVIKDVIGPIAAGSLLVVPAVKDRLHGPNKRLLEGYATWGALLPPDAKDAWHKAKSATSQLQTLLISDDLLADRNSLNLALERTRLTLTESQLTLAAALLNIRRDFVTRVLELI